MIFTLLAALYGAAQEAYVVYEGAESSHKVDDHAGSEYSWSVLIDFSPDIEADPNDYTFTSSANSHEVSVQWNRAGIYYLNVVETDIGGCTNRKVLAVNVVSNNSSIGFLQNSSTACFNSGDNDFGLSLLIYGDEGKLEESFYPVTVNFLVNGDEYSEQITYDSQVLSITSEMSKADPDTDTDIKIEIIGAVDNKNNGIKASENNIHSRTIFAQPQLAFELSTMILERNTVFEHRVNMISGNKQDAKYFWSVDPISGTSTDLTAISEYAANILWDGEIGEYYLQAYAVDGNGCISDTVRQRVILRIEKENIFVFAGRDTLIGSCNPYRLQAFVSDTTGLTYSWNPSDNLDDPTLLNPVFTPGETTEFILTVSESKDIIVRDTVEISVSDVLADAGDDVMMSKGSTVMLDGSASVGKNLTYLWTSETGQIDEGSTTANPIVSQPGIYYLEVTDEFNCTASDSVKVSVYTNAPIAIDDYDTTTYQTTVAIDVLANDYDPDGNLDPESLSIIDYPKNGVVDIGLFEQIVYYTPNDNFTGTDVFEYQVCDSTLLCTSAYVYVLVTPLNFLIPQAFTPNGDNINDYFEILGIEYYPNNSLTVINRWGKKVYEAKNYGIDGNPIFWDGKSNVGGGNSDLPTGTYFYVLDLGNGENPIAGSVYIDR